MLSRFPKMSQEAYILNLKDSQRLRKIITFPLKYIQVKYKTHYSTISFYDNKPYGSREVILILHFLLPGFFLNFLIQIKNK